MDCCRRNNRVTGLIFDLDGTIYRGNTVIPGAVQLIEELQERGISVMFYTNRAHRTPKQITQKLAGMNFKVTENQVITSALVTANALSGKRIFCIGEPALFMALENEDVTLTDYNPDFVVVGFVENLNGRELTKAVQLISDGGARFVATNQDPYILVDGKRVPENGAIVAAIKTATGIQPTVFGKPHRAGIDMALRRLKLPPESVYIVGDTPSTDIQCGQNAGIRTALILTGVTSAQQAMNSKADWIVADYNDLWLKIFGPRELS